MKKILFYFLMAGSLQMSAQSTTYFSKPVELGKVPASESKADSVLVQGTDRIIKFVPRSEFEGSQTLDQTLANGNTAMDKTITLQTTIGETSTISGSSLVLDKSPTESFHVENNRFKYRYENKGTTIENIFNLPDINGSETYLTTENSFKTIDGQSIVGSGNIEISSVLQTVDNVLATGNTAYDKNFFMRDLSDVNKFGSLSAYSASFSYNDLEGAYGGSNFFVRDNVLKTGLYASPTEIRLENPINTSGGGMVSIISEPMEGIFTQKIQPKSGIIALLSDITGGSQTLDEVLATGNEAIGKGFTLKDGDLSVNNNVYVSPTHVHMYSINNDFLITLNDRGVSVSEKNGDEGIRLKKTELNFFRFNMDSNLVQNSGSLGTSSVIMPLMSDGDTKTLATTSDIKLKSYTVSTLPIGTIGDQAYVTDATAPTYLGALSGGGSAVCPVFYNGTAWVSH